MTVQWYGARSFDPRQRAFFHLGRRRDDYAIACRQPITDRYQIVFDRLHPHGAPADPVALQHKDRRGGAGAQLSVRGEGDARSEIVSRAARASATLTDMPGIKSLPPTTSAK